MKKTSENLGFDELSVCLLLLPVYLYWSDPEEMEVIKYIQADISERIICSFLKFLINCLDFLLVYPR